jgi:hypothetical protein
VSEEEEIIIISPPKKLAAAVSAKAKGLWKSWTARFNALLASASAFVLAIPGALEYVQTHAVQLLPWLDAKSAIFVGVAVGLLNIILRARTAK